MHVNLHFLQIIDDVLEGIDSLLDVDRNTAGESQEQGRSGSV